MQVKMPLNTKRDGTLAACTIQPTARKFKNLAMKRKIVIRRLCYQLQSVLIMSQILKDALALISRTLAWFLKSEELLNNKHFNRSKF